MSVGVYLGFILVLKYCPHLRVRGQLLQSPTLQVQLSAADSGSKYKPAIFLVFILLYFC